MKKLFLLLIAGALMVPGLSYGQTHTGFAPLGAEWWIEDIPVGNLQDFLSEGINYSRCIKDTIINGQHCKKVVRKRFSKTHWYRQHNRITYDWSEKSPTFFYSSPDKDTVFAYNKNFDRFTPLYVFNVNEGDTVCLPVFDPDDLRPNPYADGDTCFCFVVDSVRYKLYDTTHLLTVYQHGIIEDDSFGSGSVYPFPVESWGMSGVFGYNNMPASAYARKLGSLYGGFFPHALHPGVSRPGPQLKRQIIRSPFGVRCYSDSTINIHIKRCLYDTTNVGINEVTFSQSLRIFPNPTTGTLNLIREKPFPKESQVRLLDNQGRVLRALPNPAGRMKMSYHLKGLPPGVYYLEVTVKGYVQTQKVVLAR